MSTKIDLAALKKKCPLPQLMELVGLGAFAKPCCPSPFRHDAKASWGIFQVSGRWMYKDLGTGEVGDEIHFLAKLRKLDPRADFRALLKIYQEIAKGTVIKPGAGALPAAKLKEEPNALGMGPGTGQQVQTLAALRGISVEGLQFAQARGVLIFGHWNGFEVYGGRDVSGRLIEVRRLDGLPFPAYASLAERKSHALKGSQKDWPLGILEAKDCAHLALAEGLPDFLALHQYVVQEAGHDRVGPVGMLASACLISPEALEHFQGKHVRLYPHLDEAGIKAAGRWQEQLLKAGACKVDLFNFSAFHSSQGSCVKDLCEFNRLQAAGNDLIERRILP